MQYMVPKISALNRTNCNFGTKCLKLLKKTRHFMTLTILVYAVTLEVNQDVLTLFVGCHILNYSISDAWTFSFSFLC